MRSVEIIHNFKTILLIPNAVYKMNCSYLLSHNILCHKETTLCEYISGLHLDVPHSASYLFALHLIILIVTLARKKCTDLKENMK